MPRQITREVNPVELSIIEFDLTNQEEPFLSYTWRREHGPGIQRDGRSSPVMERIYPRYPGATTTHPFGQRLQTWLIANDLRKRDQKVGKSELDEAQSLGLPPNIVDVLEDYLRETPKLPAHDDEFRRWYPNHRIVGLQGCGDLTMNLWNVAYINSPLASHDPTKHPIEPVLIFLYPEPLTTREYSCLIKWKAGKGPRKSPWSEVTIQNARFTANAEGANAMVWINEQPCGANIEFVVSNQQVIRNGCVVDVSRLVHQFGDLRHLFRLPNLNPRDNSGLPNNGRLYPEDSGRPRYYFDEWQTDDVWFGEAQLIADQNLQRAAMCGPVFLQRMGASLPQISGALEQAKYVQITDPFHELRRGEFRFPAENASLVEVFLQRNTYGWTMVGLNHDATRLLCLACEGNPAAGTGHTLELAAEKLVQAGAHHALLFDEGADVFQAALLQSNYPKILVAGGDELDILLPLRRTRLRSTLIIAQS